MKPDNINSLVADLSSYVRSFAGNRAWDVLACHIKVLDGVTKGQHWLINEGEKIDDGGFEEGYAEMRVGLAATRALVGGHL
ncbi:MAG: hypothetical protein Q7K57_17225 [Burkholderiaceae bacterium]|nr:hypothetical protein [Burkholderiaceae bacterium]